ncbi:MAG TPA: Hsp20/alpha crystallin family protein [Usitatibacter sp.]|jgi:HSP20 family protein|nr:Hsp20/alpha crystallin family protein [Usitatibacter sp.]
MKLDLSKWNPFKFVRRSGDERNGASHVASSAGGAAGVAAPGGGGGAGTIPDPLQLMAQMLRDPFGGLTQLDRWFGDFSASSFQPQIDVVDAGDALQVVAELPGMGRDDIEVLVEDEFLVLRGDKKLESRKDEKGCYHVERAFGSFQRIIPLPDGVDVEHAEARFENGTLTLRLPKKASARGGARKLDIKGAGAGQPAAKAPARETVG